MCQRLGMVCAKAQSGQIESPGGTVFARVEQQGQQGPLDAKVGPGPVAGVFKLH